MKYIIINQKWYKYVSIFIIAFIIGASSINAVIGKRIDKLYWENSNLKESLSATENELKEVKENLKKKIIQ
jgi:hypothetical protein